MINSGKGNYFPAGILVAATVAALLLCLPAAGVSSHAVQIPGLNTAPDLNATNSSIPNSTTLAKYRVTPTPIRIGFEYAETLADVKGEMAVGPRTIGFSLTPAALAVLSATVVAVAVVGWLAWRRRNDEGEE